jgi:hypothetical protein
LLGDSAAQPDCRAPGDTAGRPLTVFRVLRSRARKRRRSPWWAPAKLGGGPGPLKIRAPEPITSAHRPSPSHAAPGGRLAREEPTGSIVRAGPPRTTRPRIRSLLATLALSIERDSQRAAAAFRGCGNGPGSDRALADARSSSGANVVGTPGDALFHGQATLFLHRSRTAGRLLRKRALVGDDVRGIIVAWTLTLPATRCARVGAACRSRLGRCAVLLRAGAALGETAASSRAWGRRPTASSLWPGSVPASRRGRCGGGAVPAFADVSVLINVRFRA